MQRCHAVIHNLDRAFVKISKIYKKEVLQWDIEKQCDMLPHFNYKPLKKITFT